VLQQNKHQLHWLYSHVKTQLQSFDVNAHFAIHIQSTITWGHTNHLLIL